MCDVWVPSLGVRMLRQHAVTASVSEISGHSWHIHLRMGYVRGLSIVRKGRHFGDGAYHNHGGPLDRILEHDYSVAKRVPTPNDAFPRRYSIDDILYFQRHPCRG